MTKSNDKNKTLHILDIEGIYVQIMEVIYDESIMNVILSRETLKVF